jgi:hypothetical protein
MIGNGGWGFAALGLALALWILLCGIIAGG